MYTFGNLWGLQTILQALEKIMQGRWKEKIGGYDAKGTKRKRHTRKNTLKDKEKVFITKFNFKKIDNDVIQDESNKYELVGDEYDPSGIESKIHIYGKLRVNTYSHKLIFSSTKRRKVLKKIANRTTRAKMKSWLSKKDYEMDTEPKSHGLQKSIARDVN